MTYHDRFRFFHDMLLLGQLLLYVVADDAVHTMTIQNTQSRRIIRCYMYCFAVSDTTAISLAHAHTQKKLIRMDDQELHHDGDVRA